MAFTRPLGPLQPLAFLHAWRDVLQAPGREHIDPRAHRGEAPTLDEVTEFFNKHEAELEALAAKCGYVYEEAIVSASSS